MTLCVLDTDALSLLERGHAGLVCQVAARSPEQLAITVITFSC